MGPGIDLSGLGTEDGSYQGSLDRHMAVAIRARLIQSGPAKLWGLDNAWMY